MLTFLAKIIAPIIVGILSLAGYSVSSVSLLKFGDYNPSGGGTYRLQASVTSSASSITLTSFKEPVSNIPYTMAYLNSSIEYGTLEPQNNTSKEFVSFSGVTQNSDGSAVLTGVVRGLAFSFPFTASSTLQQPHPGQSIFILSNPPQFSNQYANKNNAETVSGLWNFLSAPIDNGSSTSTLQFATRGYANALAIQGAATTSLNTSGIGVLASGAVAAAGTYTLNFPRLLGSNISTSTYFGDGSNKVIITGSDNLIDKNFLPTTTTGIITWAASTTQTGLNLFTSTTTHSGGLSIAASPAVPTYFRGVPFVYPAAQGAASTTLQNNGSGTLSWLGYSKKLGTNPVTAATCIAASSASTTVWQTVVPANILGTNNAVRIRTPIGGGTLNSGDNVNFELGFGSASTTIQTTWTTAGNNKGGFYEIIIAANGATNSQKIDVTGSSGLGLGTETTFSQDSTQNLALVLVTRQQNVNLNGSQTCLQTIGEIIQ